MEKIKELQGSALKSELQPKCKIDDIAKFEEEKGLMHFKGLLQISSVQIGRERS